MGQCCVGSGSDGHDAGGSPQQVLPIGNTVEEEAAVVKTLSVTEEAEKIAAAQSKGKRGGVSAAPMSSEAIKNFERPVHAKTAHEREGLRKAIAENDKLQVLFSHLDEPSLSATVDAMRKQTVAAGETVIRQGESGDAFYIVHSGQFSIYVSRQTGGSHSQAAQKVLEVGPGACFGELALMYDAPRAATVTCTSEENGVLWALDRDPFRMMMVSAQSAKVHLYEGFLSDVVLFRDLNKYELGMLSDLLVSELYESGEDIVKQGEKGSTMYILEDGECRAFINGANGEVAVKHYRQQGEYFGEIALLKECERKATVRACGTGCSVLKLNKVDFDRVIGPIVDTLLGLLDAYPQYAAFFEDEN